MISDPTISFAAAQAPDLILRPAVPADAAAIAALVSLGEREGQLLPRSLESIRASIGDWVVATDQDLVVGCGSLVDMGPTLSEIRSLAVAPAYRKNGIGGKMVRALIREAAARRVPAVFALTRAVLFFEQLGFRISDKENFPEKVWRDCSICPVQFACDEVGMVLSVNPEEHISQRR